MNRPALPIERLYRPASVAIIGASDQSDSLGTGITRHLLDQPDSIQVHLVNRQRSLIFGQPAFADVSELPLSIDLAIVLTPWSSVPGIVQTLADRDTGCTLVVSLCDPDPLTWRSRRSDLRRMKRNIEGSSMRVIGPASQGVILPHLGLNLSLCPATPEAGSVAFLSTSGAIASVIADWAANRGLGMSSVLAMGDAADLNYPDALDYLATDATTRAVLLYLEQMPPPRRFLSALKNVAMLKPVVVLAPEAVQIGDVGDPARRRHLRGMLERCGALCVDSLDQFSAAANVDLPTWPHAGARFAIAGNGPGLSRLAANAVSHEGGELASVNAATSAALRKILAPGTAVENPLDLGRNADGARYAQSARILAADPGIDAVLLCHHPTSFTTAEQIAASLQPSDNEQAPLLAAFAGAAQDRPRHTLARRGIAAFETPEAAVQAYVLNRRYFRQRELIKQTRPALQRLISIDHARLDQLLVGGTVDSPAIFACAGVMLNEAVVESPGRLLHLATDALLGPYLEAKGKQVLRLALPIDRLSACDALVAIGDSNDVSDSARARAETDLIAIAELFHQRSEIIQISIGDPHWSDDGLLAAHVRIAADRAEDSKLVFAPYPDVDIEQIQIDDQTLILRPIRAEDEPALQEAFEHLSAEEVRMRFLHPVNAITHELAARLSQLDYDREVALVLCEPLAPGKATIFAVVRASYDLARKSAEFAIVIRRHLGRRGLGALMMNRISEMAAEAGMTELWGQVLPDNTAMLKLAEKLGFSRQSEDGLIRISLQL